MKSQGSFPELKTENVKMLIKTHTTQQEPFEFFP